LVVETFFDEESPGMDAAQVAREQEKTQLLARLAELMVEEERAKGTFDRTPHFSTLENASHLLGRDLAVTSLRRAAASDQADAACPTCGKRCHLEVQQRTLHGVDGLVEVIELVAHCPACRRDFFPSTPSDGTR
jgi:hypothetical protein